jgi:5'-3' exonuclease
MSQKTVLDVPTIITNTQFMEKFIKLFEENLEKLRKKHNVPYENIIFAKDCMRDHIWRHQHYEHYKKTRDERLTTFNGDIFKYCYSTILPDLENKLKVQSCEHNCSEADDIIAVFTRHIRHKYEDTKIIIVTNDNDYLQLIDNNTLLVNMKSLDLKTRLSQEPLIYLKMKIIMGDKSDNIPSVFPKCGEKKAQQYAEDDNLLEERFIKNPEFRERYELNKLLIDTRCVPDIIQTEILELLQFTPEEVQQELEPETVL